MQQEEKKLPRKLRIKSKIINQKSSIPLMDYWNDLRGFIDSLEIDAFAAGVGHKFAAGVRFRRGLRQLKERIHELLLLSVELDKEARSTKRAISKGRDPRLNKNLYRKVVQNQQ